MGGEAYIKPAPPVIMMFLTPGIGSNLVVPFKTGESFQTPKSSKNRWWWLPLATGGQQSVRAISRAMND